MLNVDCNETSISCRTIPEQEQASGIRNKKVQDIRRKIISGQYDPDNHLNIALDRLIEEILKQNS